LDQNSFVIELCYEAEAHAEHASRVKIKADDFQFAVRHKGRMLGRIQDMMTQSKQISQARKVTDLDEGKVVKSALEKELGLGVGRGRGTKRRKVGAAGGAAEDGTMGNGADEDDGMGNVQGDGSERGSEHSGRGSGRGRGGSAGRSIGGGKRNASAAGLD
jgi:hypothetical protein